LLQHICDCLVCIYHENRNIGHVYNYKQYITHTFIWDRGFEFAGDADRFLGDDEDELPETAPLFEVSCTFLTREVDGKETLCSLEFLNKS